MSVDATHLQASPPRQQAPRYGAAAGAADMLDLRGFLGILRRAKYLIAGVTMVATLATALFAKQMTPLFAAQATIVIEIDSRNIVDIAKVDEGLLSTDSETLETEASVIASRDMARMAVEQLDLIADPLWNPTLPQIETLAFSDAPFTTVLPWVTPQPPLWRRQLQDFSLASFSGYWQQLQMALEAWGIADILGLATDDPAADFADADPETLMGRIVSDYLAGLSVQPRRDSRVVEVEYVSPDPDFAALAANTTADLYIRAQSQAKGEATDQAAVWLQRQVRETQERFLAADRKLEQFRSDSGLTTIGGAVLPAQQLAQFSTELGRSRTELAEATARHDQVQRLQTVDPEHLATAAAVLSSSLVESLRVQELALDRRLAELRSQYREGHPQLIFTTAERRDLRRGIAAEIDKIAANLENERDIIQARVGALESEVARLQTNLNDLSASEVTLRSLESEAEASRTLFQTLLQRLKETGVQDGALQDPDARILDSAIVPLNPFFPRKKVMVILAFCAAFALSLLFAVLREFLHPGFRSLAQTESETAMPALGMIPNTKPGSILRRRTQPFRQAATKRGYIYGEAIRTLRTNLMLSAHGRAPRTVMVASSVPNEGKTSVVLSMATQFAETGRRCIVIDTDLRNPNVARYMHGLNQLSGLSDYLKGHAELADIVAEDETTGVCYIAAGAPVSQPPDLLGSPRMEALLRALRETYDLVILDSPPVLAVADALVLMAGVDAVTYLIRWEKTERAKALAGLKMATEAGANIAGVVLTRVNVAKYAKYDDAESGLYFNRAYRNYYVRA